MAAPATSVKACRRAAGREWRTSRSPHDSRPAKISLLLAGGGGSGCSSARCAGHSATTIVIITALRPRPLPSKGWDEVPARQAHTGKGFFPQSSHAHVKLLEWAASLLSPYSSLCDRMAVVEHAKQILHHDSGLPSRAKTATGPLPPKPSVASQSEPPSSALLLDRQPSGFGATRSSIETPDLPFQ